METKQSRKKFSVLKKWLTLQKLIVILVVCLLLVHEKSNATCTGGVTILISFNTTWTASTIPSSFVGQSIEIAPGVIFTIDGATLNFQKEAKIYNTGTLAAGPCGLIVENGSILQGCSGVTWGGISFIGVEQYVSYPYYSEYSYGQSFVTIDHSIIRNAVKGVYILNHAILKVSNDTFLNNWNGIFIYDAFPDYLYPSLLSSLTYTPSASYIKNTIFNIQDTTTGYPDLGQYTCVWLDSTQYIEIMGNTFECTNTPGNALSNYDLRGVGIYSSDGSFSAHDTGATQDAVTKCLDYSLPLVGNIFKWLSWGIKTSATDTTTKSYTIHVQGSTFQECFLPMQISGGYKHVIENNHISFDPTILSARAFWDTTIAYSFSTNQILIYMQGASNFIVYKNSLTAKMASTTFVQVDNSGFDQSQITANTFKNIIDYTTLITDANEYGVYFSLENRNKIVTCDSFINHYYGIYDDGSGHMSDFGSPGNGVGNYFSSLFAPGYNLYNDGTSDPVINYYTNTSPTPPSGTTGSLIIHNASNNCRDSVFESCKSWPLGFKEINGASLGVKAYPNPANNEVIFDLSSFNENKASAKISIVDVLGRTIGNYGFDGFQPQLVVNTSFYSEGVYIYRLNIDGIIEKTGKFEIRH